MVKKKLNLYCELIILDKLLVVEKEIKFIEK